MDNEKNKKKQGKKKFNFVSMDELEKVIIEFNNNVENAYSNEAIQDISLEKKSKVPTSENAIEDLKDTSSKDTSSEDSSRSLFDTIAITDIVSSISKDTSSDVSVDDDAIVDLDSKEDSNQDLITSSSNDLLDVKEESKKEEQDLLEDFSNQKEKKNDSEVPNKEHKGIHFDYWKRIVVLCILILVLGIGFLYFFYQSFQVIEDKSISYTENSDIEYSVCDKGINGVVNCLSSDIDYSSGAIHSIKTNFNYDIAFDKKLDREFSYRIVAFTKIRDINDTNKILYRNEEELFNKKFYVDENGLITFSTNVDVNFEKYNYNVLSYMKQYNLNVKADLNVILYIGEGEDSREVASIQLPLGENTFKIQKNNSNNVLGEIRIKGSLLDSSNYFYLIISIVSLCIIFILIYRIIRLFLMVRNNRNKYQVHLASLLREYDRLIVVARDGYESNVEKDIVLVASFDDLLNVRNSLEKPIIFSKINDVKCEFLVEDDKKLYKYILKEADL